MVWYLDPRFLGPFVTALVALIIGLANLSKQAGRDIRDIAVKRDEAEIKAGELALSIAKDTREALAAEKARGDRLQIQVDKLERCVAMLVRQLKEHGVEPVCDGPD